MAIRPLLIGLVFLAALVAIVLSMLFVETAPPTVSPGAFSPTQTGANPQQ